MAETTCTNRYGPESGPHSGGPAHFVAVLRSRRTGRELSRTEPLCYAHAVYEETWRAHVGGIAEVTIERVPAVEPADA